MRDLLSKMMTGSMVVGAALLVSACGGGEDANTNNTANYATDDALMGNDVTAIDAMNGTDANIGMDVNATVGNGADTTTTTTGTGNTTTGNTSTTTTTTTNTTGGNTTGM